MILEEIDETTLLCIAETKADRKHGGHLTILKFTTHWKAMFGTPNDINEEMRPLKGYPTLKKALIGLLLDEWNT
jgi:hypothetical protein